jgi:hypothetical protein
MCTQAIWQANSFQIKRLATFQSTCIQFAGDKTHKLDGWMVRFLFEYSLPLGEKEALAVMDDERIDNEPTHATAQVFEEQGRYTTFAGLAEFDQ